MSISFLARDAYCFDAETAADVRKYDDHNIWTCDVVMLSSSGSEVQATATEGLTWTQAVEQTIAAAKKEATETDGEVADSLRDRPIYVRDCDVFVVLSEGGDVAGMTPADFLRQETK